MWAVLKAFMNLVRAGFCFLFWFSGRKACGILDPWLGIKPRPPALEVWLLNHWASREVPDIGVRFRVEENHFEHIFGNVMSSHV